MHVALAWLSRLALAPRVTALGVLSLCPGLMLLAASSASGGGVNLAWNDCYPAGQTNMAFACNTNTGVPFQLFASFDPNADMTDCVANEWVIEIKSAGAALPAWWAFKGAGRCRDGSMTQSTSFVTGPYTCADPWAGAISVQTFAYSIGTSGEYSARIVGSQSLDAGSPTTVLAGTEYYSFSLVINRARTVGADACANCIEPVCLVLNQIDVVGLTGSRQLSSPRDRNHVTWHGGTLYFNCWGVPTLRPTWGQIKSLYR